MADKKVSIGSSTTARPKPAEAVGEVVRIKFAQNEATIRYVGDGAALPIGFDIGTKIYLHPATSPIDEAAVAMVCDRMLTAAIGADWRKKAPEAVTAFWMDEVRTALTAAGVAGPAHDRGPAWTAEDEKKPWGCEVAFLRHLATDPALNTDQAMMLRHCANRIESTAAQPAAAGVPDHVRRLVGKLDQWRLCMSHNDSDFGEPAGLVKSVVIELAHEVDPIYPEQAAPVDPLTGVVLHLSDGRTLSAAPQPEGRASIPFAGFDPKFCPGSNPENPQTEDDIGPAPAGRGETQELLKRALPFLRDEGTKFDDDGSNEPLELAREIEAFVAAAARPVADIEALADWLAIEMPPGTVIGDPRWWAKHIARRLTGASDHG